MRLRFNELEREYIITEGRVNCLIVENPDLFDRLLLLVNQQISGQADTISICESKIGFQKMTDLIVSPLDISLNGNKLKKQLFGLLEGEFGDAGYIDRVVVIFEELIKLLDDLSCRIDFDIVCDCPNSFIELLSACNVKLEEPEGKFLERISVYMKCIHRLLGKKLFVIYNCAGFMSNEDLDLLNTFTEYEGITILLIDYQQNNNVNGNRYIIDNTLCDIY